MARKQKNTQYEPVYPQNHSFPSRFDAVQEYIPLPVDHMALLDKFDAEHGVRTIMDEDDIPFQLGWEEGIKEGEENADTTYQNALGAIQHARTVGKPGKHGTYITLHDTAVDAVMDGLPDLAVADPEESRAAYRQHVLNAVEKALDAMWNMLPKNVKGD
jgi:hypothetical protein